jgi:hypothetical protein
MSVIGMIEYYESEKLENICWGNHKTSATAVVLRNKIWNRDLPNKKEECMNSSPTF